MGSVKTAIFPVAGLGSRFLPATKANPKEMLPIVDKPLIQYAVEEAVRAGIVHMVFITSSSKRAIEDHFDTHYELESRLAGQGKDGLLALVQSVSPPGITFTYIRQNQPLGLGHAVLCAEQVVGDSPFAVLLADDLIDDRSTPCLSAMARHYKETGMSVVAVQPVPMPEVHLYGVVDVPDISARFNPVKGIVEKPSREHAPSNLAAVGRYVLTPGIFDCLRETPMDARGEIQLTGGIERLLERESVQAFRFDGRRYDCGSKLGYLQATVELGMAHPEVGARFTDWLLELEPVSLARCNQVETST